MSLVPSILDNVNTCCLLHGGGEANIYVISDGTSKFVLKWYRGGTSFDESQMERLERLRIPGIYRIRESGSRDEIPYLVYDYIEGVNSRMAGRVPVPVALCMLRQVAQTLTKLDSEGIHHGDLNPANIIFGLVEGDLDHPLQAVMVDFGIVGPGMPAYAAPERFQGKNATVASDLFSLGMVLFSWISGEELIQASEYEEFQSRTLEVDSVLIDEKLYGLGCFSASEISALTPLWKALLRSEPQDRCEDFDELDELIEIALDSLGMGDVQVSLEIRKFTEFLKREKSGRNTPVESEDALKTDFPYKKQGVCSPKKTWKIVFLIVFGLILTMIALFVAVGTKSPDIDATGSLLLERSRSLETETMVPDSEQATRDSVPSNLLEDLPTPSQD